MTLSTLTVKVTGNGNDSATTFSFSPVVLPTASSELEVVHRTAAGVETTLTEDTDYTVTVSSYPGTGSISYPVSGDPLPTGESLIMKRVLPLKQLTDLENGAAYFAEVLELQLDQIVMIAQQQQDDLDRAVKFGVGEDLSSFDENIPTPVANRALTVNNDGDGFQWATFASLSTSFDTSFSGLASGDYLAYNGATWENQTPAELLTALSLPTFTSVGTALAEAASKAAAQQALDLEPGVDLQAYDADTAKTDVAQSFTAPQRADQATVTDGTLDLDAAQNFHYTPSGADTLEFSNEAVGQSGMIYLVNGSDYAITLGSEITGPADMASDISATGNYLISYWVHTAGGGADSVACSYVEVV